MGEDERDDGDDPLADALGDEASESEDAPDDPVDAFVEDVTERPGGDTDEDPFERMGAGPVPEGDPFERLEGDPGGESDTADAQGWTEPDRSGPGPDGDTDATDSREVEAPTDPFDGFASAEGDPFGGGQSVFESVDAGDVDPDGVWEQMDREEGDDAAVEDVPGRRYVEVSKHSYCERCEHFSGPPEVSCSHEGTQILEFTDMETVRLVDCPIVAERQALEDEG